LLLLRAGGECVAAWTIAAKRISIVAMLDIEFDENAVAGCVRQYLDCTLHDIQLGAPLFLGVCHLPFDAGATIDQLAIEIALARVDSACWVAEKGDWGQAVLRLPWTEHQCSENLGCLAAEQLRRKAVRQCEPKRLVASKPVQPDCVLHIAAIRRT